MLVLTLALFGGWNLCDKPRSWNLAGEQCYTVSCQCRDCSGSSCKCGSVAKIPQAIPVFNHPATPDSSIVDSVLITEDHFHGKPWPVWAKNAGGFYPTLGAYLVLYSNGKIAVVDSVNSPKNSDSSNHSATLNSSQFVRVCGPNGCSMVPVEGAWTTTSSSTGSESGGRTACSSGASCGSFGGCAVSEQGSSLGSFGVRYSGASCSGGNCGTARRGLFGRRR